MDQSVASCNKFLFLPSTAGESNGVGSNGSAGGSIEGSPASSGRRGAESVDSLDQSGSSEETQSSDNSLIRTRIDQS